MTSQVRIRVGVCLCDGARMLLVQHEKEGSRYWLLPGGGVEVGETLAAAAVREVEEETGYRIRPGRVLLLCEAIQPGGRHIVNVVFHGEIAGGAMSCGADGTLCDVAWHDRSDLARLPFFPPVMHELLGCWAEGFSGPVRVLGNVWREGPDPPPPDAS